MKWRLALINATLPTAAFYTVQWEDNRVEPYTSSIQGEFSELAKHFKLVLSPGGGDAFSEWFQDGLEMPYWLSNVIDDKG